MRAGLLSTENLMVRDAEALSLVEGSIRSTDMARGSESRGVEEPMHVRTHCTGTWEVSMSSRCRGGIAEERSNS